MLWPIAFVNGSAFHLYAGDISAMSQVHNLYPEKQLYFTEQYTGSTSQFSDDLKWSVKNVIIGSMRNWSRNALEWNLANDPSFWSGAYPGWLYNLQRGADYQWFICYPECGLPYCCSCFEICACRICSHIQYRYQCH